MGEGLSQPALRFALGAAVLAAIVLLTGLFSDVVGFVALGVIVVATLATGEERHRKGGGWWTLLGAGAVLSVLGAGIAQLADTVGGLIAVVGAALVVIGAVIGFPVDPDAE